MITEQKKDRQQGRKSRLLMPLNLHSRHLTRGDAKGARENLNQLESPHKAKSRIMETRRQVEKTLKSSHR